MHIKNMGTDEAELIAHILGGDREQYRVLVDRHKDSLYRHCFYIMHDEDAAEDMAQEAFIRAFRYLSRYDTKKASFKTWLYTIATRLCLAELRKTHPLPLEDQDTLVSAMASPRQLAENLELYEAVVQLKPNYRTVIILHYWHGYSYEDIATYMQAPIGSVRGWLHRAKKQLKEALS